VFDAGQSPLSRRAGGLNPPGVGNPGNLREAIATDSVLHALKEQLHELQQAQIAHGRRAIILLEGPEGSGKKAALRHLAAAFDPCHFTVHQCQFDRREAGQGHWLARFWAQLPTVGNTAIFFRSWYRRVIDDRVLGRVDESAMARSFDEINEFEAQQRDYGTLIVKLYFDAPAEAQQRRLEQRAANPWRQPHRELPVETGDPAYVRAMAELKAHSDTRWSPWKTIDAADDQRSILAALEAIAEAWSKAMPAEPPHLVGVTHRVA
jgi:polyphosphate kinase 2 (PPK2 family)